MYTVIMRSSVDPLSVVAEIHTNLSSASLLVS